MTLTLIPLASERERPALSSYRVRAVGQGLSGISTASLSSVIAVLAIAAGGYGMMRLRAPRTEAVIAPDLRPAE